MIEKSCRPFVLFGKMLNVKLCMLRLFWAHLSAGYISYVTLYVFLCGSVVEHCVSSAKGCGFDSHILMKLYNLNAIVSRFG